MAAEIQPLYEPAIDPRNGRPIALHASGQGAVSSADELQTAPAFIEAVVRDAAQLVRHGLSLPMTIGVSSESVCASGFVDRLMQACLRQNLPSRLLEICVTQKELVDQPEALPQALRRIYAAQIRVCIDEFGSSAIPIRQIVDSEAVSVRLPRVFVASSQDATGAPSDRLLKAHVQVAHMLGLSVIVPWVETKAQAENFRRLRCQMLQGPLICEPLPFRELLAYLYRTCAASVAAGGIPDSRPSGPMRR